MYAATPCHNLAISFAVELLDRNQATAIGIFPCAVGGTPLTRWMPEADLFEHAVSVTQKAIAHGSLKGILWHQGEADAWDQVDADSYGNRLQSIVHARRTRLNACEVPVVAGELGHFLRYNNECKHVHSINRQLNDLRSDLANYACASASQLIDNDDDFQFNSPSLREFGVRYAQKYIGWSHR